MAEAKAHETRITEHDPYRDPGDPLCGGGPEHRPAHGSAATDQIREMFRSRRAAGRLRYRRRRSPSSAPSPTSPTPRACIRRLLEPLRDVPPDRVAVVRHCDRRARRQRPADDRSGPDGRPTVYTPGEGTAINESSPTLGTATITPVSYKALTYVTWEAIEDVEYPLMQRIAQSHARAIALDFGSDAIHLRPGRHLQRRHRNRSRRRCRPPRSSASRTCSTSSTAGQRPTGGRRLGVQQRRHPEGPRSSPTLGRPYLAACRRGPGQPDTFDGTRRIRGPVPRRTGHRRDHRRSSSAIWGRALVIKATTLRVATQHRLPVQHGPVAIKCGLRADVAVVDSAAAAYPRQRRFVTLLRAVPAPRLRSGAAPNHSPRRGLTIQGRDKAPTTPHPRRGTTRGGPGRAGTPRPGRHTGRVPIGPAGPR